MLEVRKAYAIDSGRVATAPNSPDEPGNVEQDRIGLISTWIHSMDLALQGRP